MAANVNSENPSDDAHPRKRQKLAPRTFAKIPIFIVDYHHEVLEFVYRCLASRHIPLEANTLIHFDSHPDMVIPRHIKASTVYNKDLLLPELSIENWIMPTCYAGHFTKLVWVKNSWCDQIPAKSHEFKIGDKDDIIHVSCPVKYFISEGNYCDENDLKNSRQIQLHVINSGEDQTSANLEDDQNYVLDIDLDYFSTTNPFLAIYDKANCYEKLKEIFTYASTEDQTDHRKTCEQRAIQLDALKNVFVHLEENRSLEDLPKNDSISEDTLCKIRKLVSSIQSSYDDTEIDWNLVYDSGCTCDDGGLPHHISTDAELEEYYQHFKNFLKILPYPPIAITIARSSGDDYCPKDQVDEIQGRVLEILADVFKDKLSDNPILAYEDEVWDVMKL